MSPSPATSPAPRRLPRPLSIAAVLAVLGPLTAGFAADPATASFSFPKQTLTVPAGFTVELVAGPPVVNRPISMAITRIALCIPGLSPMHATAASALVGLVMTMLLFQGTGSGLIAGAILFQAASIIDGVDGEVARATFRTSDLGAKLDSLTDAATNLAFLAGVSFNMYHNGEVMAATAGMIGLVAHGLGFFLLGRQTVHRRAPLSFDALKHATFAANSKVVKYGTYLMTRDFYAAASVLMVLFGLTTLLLPIYAAAATLWLAFVAVFLFHQRAPGRELAADGDRPERLPMAGAIGNRATRAPVAQQDRAPDS